MQDVTETILQDRQSGSDTGLSARLTRQERQARVGILRNPASPPRPPVRRAQLMGRWLNLRSSRRPPGADVAAAAESVVTTLTADHAGPRPGVPVRRAADGTVQSIDIAGLMASVGELGSKAPVRAAFASSMRPDGDSIAAPPAELRKAPILTAATLTEDDASDEDNDALAAAFRDAQPPVVPQKPQRSGRRALRIVSLGIILAAVALILLPAWGALLPA